jgi:hypothetical protein
MSALTRELVIRPAWDKRNPDPKKNYGIHCAGLCFYVKGPLGAVQFVMYTGWFLPQNAESMSSERLRSVYPMAADLGYHSPKPRHKGQTLAQKDCEILHSPCYYDGSGLNAEPIMAKLIAEGSEAVWQALEAYYVETFET